MPPRPRLHLSWQILLAGVLGVAAGRMLPGGWDAATPVTLACWGLCELAGSLYLTWAKALAVPLVVSSVILSAVGLEPMRGLGRVAVKTAAWMAGSTVVAALLGGVAAYCLGIDAPGQGKPPLRIAPEAIFRSGIQWYWPGLVLVCLGLGYYRNQIQEGHGRLMVRFCLGLDEMLAPMLLWLRRLTPWAVFALMTTVAAHGTAEISFDPYTRDPARLPEEMAAGWTVYGMAVLPAVLWLAARVNPWTYFRIMLPAALAAFAGGSTEAALPLTLDAARRGAGMSNRVAGVVLPLCATLQRDGLALGWAAIAFDVIRPSPLAPGWSGENLWTACALGVLAAYGGTNFFVLLVLPLAQPERMPYLILIERLLAMGGAAVSVLSQSCIAAVIAKGEGEYWIPGPPPDAADLQELKAELEIIDN